MKRKGLIGAAVIAVCFIAFVCGRTYQNSVLPRTSALASPTPATIANAPTDFGSVVYRDLASISFADLYETLRQAPAQSRAQWLRELEQTPESPRKVAALCGFFRALVQAHPQTAADLVINLPRHRGPAMDAMILAAPPSAMPVLAEMLLKVPEKAREYQLTDHIAVVLDEWAQVDPEAAAAFLDQHQDLQVEQYADTFLDSWAAIDHEAAWNWLKAHFEDPSEFKVQSWLQGWFSADQDAAIEFALEHLDDGKFAEASTSFAPQLFEQDQNIAKKFIEKLPSSELRKAALNALREAGSPDYSDDYQPDVVAKFIAQFPVDEWPDGVSDVINRWRFRDIPGLLDWISHLSSEQQDKVVSNFPEPISYEREAELLPVLQLPQSDLRTKLLRQLVLGMQADAERFENQSGREVIEKLQLSPGQKAELAGFLPKKE